MRILGLLISLVIAFLPTLEAPAQIKQIVEAKVTYPVLIYLFEAEQSLSHLTGRQEGKAWAGAEGRDKADYLCYGPYAGGIEPGDYLACFRLKTDTVTGEKPFLTLDVNDFHAGAVLAELAVAPKDFKVPGQYQDICLAFTSGPDALLEFRTRWNGRGKVWVDRVRIHGTKEPAPPPVPENRGPFSFSDVTRWAKVPNIPECGGHGACWADVDGDGDDDLYVTNIIGEPSLPDVLYINQGNGTFTREDKERHVTDKFPIGTHGAVFADVDADGDFDLFNGTTSGKDDGIFDHLYLNDGTGYFQILQLLGKNTATRAVIAGDFDRDGDLDLFSANQTLNPFVTGRMRPFETPLELPDVHVNNGKRYFRSEYRGMPYTGFTQGAVAADIDGDGDIDIGQARWAPPSEIYFNDGSGNFTPVGAKLRLPQNQSLFENGMVLGDIDNDGDLDVLLVGGAKDQARLYRNDGKQLVLHQKLATAGADFSASFGDFDHDGDLDLYFSGGALHRNDGSGNFTSVPKEESGLRLGFNSPRACALADYDNDGDLDIYVTPKHSTSRLFRNNRNDRNWLKVKLTSPQGVAGAPGAKVCVYDKGKAGNASALRGFREAITAYGYLGQDSPILHFGLPEGRYDVRVRYLTGWQINLTEVATGQTLELRGTELVSKGPAKLTFVLKPERTYGLP